jgi:dolichol-phosphate mannosyltransferase
MEEGHSMTVRSRHARSGIYLSLVLPAYNEAAGIALAIAEADQALASLGYSYEILMVDDGSRDGTMRTAALAAVGRPRVRLLQHAHNQGYGAALRTGFEAARGQLVAFTDADCQFHLRDLRRLIRHTDRFPVVAGYRVRRKDPWQRRLFSRGYNLLARAFLGTRVRDCDCALKVFRREALAQLLPNTTGYFVNSEMLSRARQLDLPVAEVAVRHRRRLRGRSKVSVRDIPRTLRSFVPYWWSEVEFPGRAGDREPGGAGEKRNNPSAERDLSSFAADTSAKREKQPVAAGKGERLYSIFPFLLLLLLGSVMFFTRLSTPLQEPEEARYAEVPRQMLAENRIAAPVLHGESYYQKPPLVYWLVMSAYQIFGVHDWAARVVPSGAAVVLIGLVYWWGRGPLGNQGAFLASLILCLSARFVYLARLVTLDGVLALCVVAALLAAYRALTEPASGCEKGVRPPVLRGQTPFSQPTLKKKWWLVSALCCGLGLLTKGPVALALVAIPVLVFTWLDPRVRRPGLGAWATFLALASGIAAPWYLMMAVTDPEAAGTFFILHNVLRYVVPFDHPRPFWFYGPEVLIGLFPWTLLLVPLVPFLLRRDLASAKRRSPALGFFLLSLLWCVVFFSCSGCKRPVYLLPALPLLAMVLGCYVANAVSWRALSWRSIRLIQVPAAGTTCAVLFMLAILSAGIGACVLAITQGLWDSTQGLLVGAILCGLLAVTCTGIGRWHAPTAWTGCVVMLTLLQFGAIYQLLPEYHRRNSLRGQVRRFAEWCSKEQVPVLCYPRLRDSVSFYLQKHPIQACTPLELANKLDDLKSDQPSLVFINSRSALKEFVSALPASLQFVPCGRQGKQLQVGMVQPRLQVVARSPAQ